MHADFTQLDSQSVRPWTSECHGKRAGEGKIPIDSCKSQASCHGQTQSWSRRLGKLSILSDTWSQHRDPELEAGHVVTSLYLYPPSTLVSAFSSGSSPRDGIDINSNSIF